MTAKMMSPTMRSQGLPLSTMSFYLPGEGLTLSEVRQEVNVQPECTLPFLPCADAFLAPVRVSVVFGAGLCFVPCPDPLLTFRLFCFFRNKLGRGLH